jgi:hypothetical protein
MSVDGHRPEALGRPRGWWPGAIVALAALICTSPQALAQSAKGAECATLRAAVEEGSEAVPFELLTDSDNAALCLVGIIASVGTRLQSPRLAELDAKVLTRATGALNVVVTETDKKIVALIRSNDSKDFIRALTFGARSDNKDLRSNATVLLANTIDNNTICIVLDHLYDNKDSSEEFWTNGRANLLAVAAVISPWALRENYENIQRVVQNVEPMVSKDDPNLEITRELLVRIRNRLSLQDEYNNPKKESTLTAANLDGCADYVPEFATAEQLIY